DDIEAGSETDMEPVRRGRGAEADSAGDVARAERRSGCNQYLVFGVDCRGELNVGHSVLMKRIEKRTVRVGRNIFCQHYGVWAESAESVCRGSRQVFGACLMADIPSNDAHPFLREMSVAS